MKPLRQAQSTFVPVQRHNSGQFPLFVAQGFDPKRVDESYHCWKMIESLIMQAGNQAGRQASR
jgi:hypothetical protein